MGFFAQTPNPDWFPEEYLEFESAEGHFIAVLRARENRLKRYHEADLLKIEMRIALRDKGLIGPAGAFTNNINIGANET